MQKSGNQEDSNSHNLTEEVCSFARNLIQIPSVPVPEQP